MATAHDCEAIPSIRQLFDSLFMPGVIYRSTMVWLGKLVTEHGRQYDMFEDTPARETLSRLDDAVDSVNRRYGQCSLAPATILDATRKPLHSRDIPPERHSIHLKGERVRRLAIPRLTLTNPV